MANKEFNRLIALQEVSPIEMDVLVKTIHGTHHGTVRWTDRNGKIHIRRWLNNTIVPVLSEFTAALIAYLYGGEEPMLSLDTDVEYEITVRYQWLELHKDYYIHFTSEDKYIRWLKYHQDWLSVHEKI